MKDTVLDRVVEVADEDDKVRGLVSSYEYGGFSAVLGGSRG